MPSSVLLFLGRSNVVPFPRDAGVDRSPEATLRRVRFAAMSAGCNGAQVKATEGYAEGLLAAGMPSHKVVDAARSYAEQLLPKVPA